MDLTDLFKSLVRDDVCNEQDSKSVNKTSSHKIFNKKENSVTLKAKLIVYKISELQNFLLKNRTAYLNFSNRLLNKESMTDIDRDNIDVSAKNILSECSSHVQELEHELSKSNSSAQIQNHQKVMLIMIQEYLKKVCKIYSEQKAIRLKKSIELKKASKIEPVSKVNKSTSNNLNHTLDPDVNDTSSLKVQEINGDVNGVFLDQDEQLSTEDFQIFEAENKQLYDELNSVAEEVKELETKVVHIAELQEIFTEKVLEQDKNLDRLLTTVVGSTENVQEGNEQIRQAIQRNAGFRVWILLFLLVMSFSLLFLDWYYP